MRQSYDSLFLRFTNREDASAVMHVLTDKLKRTGEIHLYPVEKTGEWAIHFDGEERLPHGMFVSAVPARLKDTVEQQLAMLDSGEAKAGDD